MQVTQQSQVDYNTVPAAVLALYFNTYKLLTRYCSEYWWHSIHKCGQEYAV